MAPGRVQARYFDWLYRQVKAGDYAKLCHLMHQTTFRVLVAHDENRVGDVNELKLNYMTMMRIDPRDEDGLTSPDASVFEILVSLAQRMEYQTSLPIQVCFAIFLENLGLRSCNDDNFSAAHRTKATQIIKRFNDRLYRPNGQGGLFPLRKPRGDQRQVELWYQMAFYLTENEIF
jgi:hypothetical protein